MKYLVVSDIHGCRPALEKVVSFYKEGGYERMLILGDVLNYGPRNGVPEGLDAMGIVDILSGMADEIVAIRGNCDSEVDQMLLPYPMMADCTMVVDGGVRMFLTHGHIYSPSSKPSCGIDIFFSGHTHLWELRREEDAAGEEALGSEGAASGKEGALGKEGAASGKEDHGEGHDEGRGEGALGNEGRGTVICNTGSITFPKEGRPATFATVDCDGTGHASVKIICLDNFSILAEIDL